MSRYSYVLTFCVIAAAGLCLCTVAPKAYGLAESVGPDGSNAKAVNSLYGETGQDINVGFISGGWDPINNIWVGGLYTEHEAFNDTEPHAFEINVPGGPSLVTSWHDTAMAGIINSRGGVERPNYKGVAYGADVYYARVVGTGTLEQDHFESALDILKGAPHNCRTFLFGFATEAAANGSSTLTKIVDYYAYEYDLIFAIAAGNVPDEILAMGDAYNGITTSSLSFSGTAYNIYRRVDPGSSTGTTEDGRRKPDVSTPMQWQTCPWYNYTDPCESDWMNVGAYGEGATSWAVPHAAGVAALLLGLANDTAEPNDGHNEVIKAAIVNSTFPNINDRDNNSTNPADPNNVWHPHRGYGRIDALRAYELLNTDQISPDVNTTQQKGWAYATMTTNYEQHSYFTLGSKNHRLVLTVTWNRRISKLGSTYTEESSPKFNLDLTIEEPSGQILFSETDTLNNLEKVDIVLPIDGMYEIILENTTTKKDRSYALAFELLPPIPGDFAPLDYIVDYVDLARLKQEWLLTIPDLEADLVSDDNTVDMKDFTAFANHWLEIEPAYYQQP